MVYEFFYAGTFFGAMIGIAGVIIYGLVMKRIWPVRVPIAIQRGSEGSVVWDLDERAKMIRMKSGYEILRLKKRKHNIKPPKYEEVSIQENGKPVYPVYNTTSGQYFPSILNNPKFKLHSFSEEELKKNPQVLEKLVKLLKGKYFPIGLMKPPSIDVVEDKSAKNFAIQELSRVRSTYMEKESLFLKYAPYIMNATFAAMVIFFIIYFGGKMESVAGALGGAADALTKAVTGLRAMPTAPPV